MYFDLLLCDIAPLQSLNSYPIKIIILHVSLDASKNQTLRSIYLNKKKPSIVKMKN